MNRSLVMAGLFTVGVMSYVDRTIISLLQVPIKTELGLSDTQLGSLTGIAFALVYTGAAIPIARVADRSSRKRIILLSLFVWSVMTAFSGFARSFISLVLLRMGVALGEAGSIPATHSMIGDLYPPEDRTRATSAWGLNLPAGLVVGLIAAGQITQAFGWRTSFWLIGAAGVFLVPILARILVEPTRFRGVSRGDEPRDGTSLFESLAVLWDIKAYRFLAIGGAFHAVVQYALLFWTAPFYTRVHGLSLIETSRFLAILNGVGGIVGIGLGGWLAHRAGRRDIRWQLRVPACAMAILVPTAFVQFTVNSVVASLAFGLLTSTLVVFYYAPIVAVPMLVVAPHRRALASSIIMAVFNLVGLGLGPTLTGMLSDFFAAHGTDPHLSLRASLTVMSFPSLIAAALFWLSSNWLKENLTGELKSSAMVPSPTVATSASTPFPDQPKTRRITDDE